MNSKHSEHPYWHKPASEVANVDGRPKRATAQRIEGHSYFPKIASYRPSTPQKPTLAPVQEGFSPGGTADGYSPFSGDSSANVVSAVAESIYDACSSVGSYRDPNVLPITGWKDVDVKKRTGGRSRRNRTFTMEVSLLAGDGSFESEVPSLLAQLNEQHSGWASSVEAPSVHGALRADSPDAPSTHREAMRRGDIWVKSERTELDNHARNESWETITLDQVPRGRRLHKLIWVYKVKRDGTAKSRLCVQGTTLEAGVDYQQVFAAALRHSSARALFAFAARNKCKVRSVDLVAAYLQGQFIEGEVVYCYLPDGHVEYDGQGRPKVAKVMKPIYGIQQAGRRLQRMLFDWMTKYGFKCHDDSDNCIFSLECPGGEILTIGVYVDNLQIIHSVELDANGRGPKGCAYNAFMDALTSSWDVVDEGPMEDLLGIEVDYLEDGSIKLHQTKYIKKIVERFLPHGLGNKVQKASLPYSSDFLLSIIDALSQSSVEHPELVKPMQEIIGCLMYATVSTRPDIAFAVHALCKCMHKPTPAVMLEAQHVLAYLARNADLGLTYSSEHVRLSGFADASWEAKHSTSGWVVLWQSAALSWGSRKQKSIALSTCEAEIIALSEAAKDVVYLRKLVKGLGAPEPGPTHLSTDSSSARDVSYNPEHHDRMKHVERRHFFIRDMVESFELEVPYVPTSRNPADFFTKPMKSASAFREFRAVIMNEPR